MTATTPPLAPTGPAPPRVRDRSGRSWGGMWVLAVLTVVPAATPIGYLVWSAVRPVGRDTGGVSADRLVELSVSTLTLVVVVTMATSVIGFATAWLTTRTDLSGRRAWSTLVSLPLVVPSYVGALTLLGATGNRGLISEILRTFGGDGVGVLKGFWAAALALTVWNFPFVHLLAVPALRRLDPALEESARALGSGRLRTIRTVVLPQLRRSLTSAGLLVALYVVSDFGAVSLLRYETFTLAIYTQFRGRLDPTPALFISGILVLGSLAIIAIERRVRGRARGAPSSRTPRRSQHIQLTPRARFAATTFLALLTTLALALPLATLGWWVFRGAAQGSALASSAVGVTAEATRSLLTSTAAAALTATAAIPLAIVTVRRAGRAARVLESAAWAAYSLPHLAVGLAFLVLAVRFVRPIYQSLPLLLIAYMAMFMPQAMAATQVGLTQIGPNLEAASRGLGAGAIETFRRITLPLLAPSVVAGAGLVFLTVMKELPATLLLRPTGFETLAIRIWSASSELFYTQASVAALVLIAISAPPLYFLVIRDIHAR